MRILDRHHRHHPASQYWHPENVLSFGFTSHYDTMWRTFRRTPLGIAGEKVIVETDRTMTLYQIGGGLRIESDEGVVEFDSPQIAEPCVEFTRFMADRPDARAREIKPDREKLRNGVRGFVVGVGGPAPVDVKSGDRVLVRPGQHPGA